MFWVFPARLMFKVIQSTRMLLNWKRSLAKITSRTPWRILKRTTMLNSKKKSELVLSPSTVTQMNTQNNVASVSMTSRVTWEWMPPPILSLPAVLKSLKCNLWHFTVKITKSKRIWSISQLRSLQATNQLKMHTNSLLNWNTEKSTMKPNTLKSQMSITKFKLKNTKLTRP